MEGIAVKRLAWLLVFLAAPVVGQVCTSSTHTGPLTTQPKNCSGGTRDGFYCFDAGDCSGGTCVNANAASQCIGGTNDGGACTHPFDCPGSGARCGQPQSMTQAEDLFDNLGLLCTAADTFIVSTDMDTLAELNTQVSASLTDGAHTTDTGPSPDCSGTSTYQDGEGGCDAVGGDLSGGLDAAVVGDDSHAHTTTTLSGIAVSDLADGTDGELITWDATGEVATVAVGTATHVLTSNGAGAAPTFQAAAGGGLSNVVEDTTPQLGGDLDVNGNDITHSAPLNLFGGGDTGEGVEIDFDDGGADDVFQIGDGVPSGGTGIHVNGGVSFDLYADSTFSLRVDPQEIIAGSAAIYTWSTDGDTYMSRAGADSIWFTIGGEQSFSTVEAGGALTTTIYGDDNEEGLIVVSSGGADVNEVTVTSNATGNGPTISATGGDTNIDLNLTGKGSGAVNVGVLFQITPQASAPATCAIGDFYSDTSGAACACTATNTWSNMTATGACT